MSTTGATSDQIEDAVERQWKHATERGITQGDASFEMYFFRHLPRMRQHAEDLVSERHRIVLADDLRVILKKALESPNPTRESDAAYDRLLAAIGTPTVDPVCPRCGERTVESPRIGRTCVDDACGWRERE